jgi:hypothetical protein
MGSSPRRGTPVGDATVAFSLIMTILERLEQVDQGHVVARVNRWVEARDPEPE